MNQKAKSAERGNDVVSSLRLLLQQNWTMVKFAIVGASGVVVNLGILAILTTAFGNGLIFFYNAVAVEASILSNFVWNDKFTFKTLDESSGLLSGKFGRFVKYNLLSLVSFSVNELVFSGLYSVGLEKYIASLIAIGASFIVNYLGSSRWAWRSSWLSSKTTMVENSKPSTDSKELNIL